MKKLLFLALFLFVPFQTHAMTRPVFSLIDQAVPAATNFLYPWDAGMGGGAGNGSTINYPTPVAVPGTVQNLTASLAFPPGAGTSETVTLVKNTSATALTCVIADPATSCTDTTDSVAIVAGDTLQERITATGSTLANFASLSTSFTGTNADEAPINGASSGGVSATSYFPPNGGQSSATETKRTVVAPTSFTLDQLNCSSSAAAGAGNSWTMTLFKNDVATALSSSISGATQVLCTPDTTDLVSYTASDTLSMQVAVGGAPTSRIIRWGMRLKPSIDGEFPLMTSQTALSIATRWNPIVGSSGSNIAEASSTALAPVAFTLSKAYASAYIPPQTGHQWVITSRRNSGAGNLSLTILQNTNIASDLVNSDSESVNDLIDWQTVPTTGSAAINNFMTSAVAFIPPANPAASVFKHFIQGGSLAILGGSFSLF